MEEGLQSDPTALKDIYTEAVCAQNPLKTPSQDDDCDVFVDVEIPGLSFVHVTVEYKQKASDQSVELETQIVFRYSINDFWKIKSEDLINSVKMDSAIGVGFNSGHSMRL